MMDERHHEKLSLLQQLIALSKVDDSFGEMEEQFIYNIAHSLGISDLELDALKKNPVDYNPEDGEMDRITQFYRLLLLMGVDKHKHEDEIAFCKNAGLTMGLRPAAVDEVVQRFLASESGMLDPQVLIQIFKTHHN